MKRTIGALLLALGLTLGVVAPQVAHSAPADQVRGKGCGDITVDANYTTGGGAIPASAAVTVDTAKPSCTDVTYVLRVFTTGGAQIGEASVIGDGSSRFNLLAPAEGAPTQACISVTSETGAKVIDSAPDRADLECATGAFFLLDGATGGKSMR